MSEAEIIELISLARGHTVSVVQWWASITFALVAFAHLGRRSLNLLLVVIVLVLYVAFSIDVVAIVSDQTAQSQNLLRDLGQLAQDSGQSSSTSEFLRTSRDLPRFAQIASAIVVVGGFLSSMAYVVYMYMKFGRRRIEPE